MSFHPFPLSTFPLLPTLFSISFLSTSSSSSFSFSFSPWFCHQQLWGAEVRQEPAWSMESCPGGCLEHLWETSLTMKATLQEGIYGLNTEPWIQPASEWVAVGKAKILVLRDLSRWGCKTLLSERCFAFFSVQLLTKAEYWGSVAVTHLSLFSLDSEKLLTLWIEKLQTLFTLRLFPKQVTLLYCTLLQHSLYQVFSVSWLSFIIKVNFLKDL